MALPKQDSSAFKSVILMFGGHKHRLAMILSRSCPQIEMPVKDIIIDTTVHQFTNQFTMQLNGADQEDIDQLPATVYKLEGKYVLLFGIKNLGKLGETVSVKLLSTPALKQCREEVRTVITPAPAPSYPSHRSNYDNARPSGGYQDRQQGAYTRDPNRAYKGR